MAQPPLLGKEGNGVGCETGPIPLRFQGGVAAKRPGWLVKGREASFYARPKGAPYDEPQKFSTKLPRRDAAHTASSLRGHEARPEPHPAHQRRHQRPCA